MRAVYRSDWLRLSRYGAVAGILYMLAHLVGDFAREQFKPSAWLAMTPANITEIGIGLIVVGLIQVNTLNEGSRQ